MPDPHIELLRESARLCRRLEFLWAAYPPEACYEPLRMRAGDLAGRIENSLELSPSVAAEPVKFESLHHAEPTE